MFIVLETPTSGLHVRAFNNAVQFIAEWQRVYAEGEPSPAPIELRIVGPTFSGSVPMMTSALAALVKPLSIASLVVVSGSATDDGNAEKFDALCRAGRPQLVNCSYGSAMHSNHDTAFGLLRYLDHVSPSWLPAGVGLRGLRGGPRRR